MTWLVRKCARNSYSSLYPEGDGTSIYLLVVGFDIIEIISPGNGDSVLTAQRSHGCDVRLFENNQEMNLLVETSGNERQETSPSHPRHSENYQRINSFVFEPYFETDRQLIMKAIIYWQHPAASKLVYSKMTSEKQPVVLDFTRPLQISGFADLSTLLKSEPRCLLLQSDVMILCSMDVLTRCVQPIIQLEYADIVDFGSYSTNAYNFGSFGNGDYENGPALLFSFIDGFEMNAYVLKSQVDMAMAYVKGQIARRINHRKRMEQQCLQPRFERSETPTFTRVRDSNAMVSSSDINAASTSINRLIEDNLRHHSSSLMFKDDRKLLDLNATNNRMPIERNERPLHPRYLLKATGPTDISDKSGKYEDKQSGTDSAEGSSRSTIDRYRYKTSIFKVDSAHKKVSVPKQYVHSTETREAQKKSTSTFEALKTDKPEDNPEMGTKSQVSPSVSENRFVVGDQRGKNSFRKAVRNESVEPVVLVAGNKEKVDKQGDSKDTGVTSDELLNVFKERVRSAPTHRDNPVVIRRSSLLDDDVGTLPFAESPKLPRGTETVTVSLEQDNNDTETDVTGENFSSAEERSSELGDKKMSAAAKKFQKLVVNSTSATHHSANEQERGAETQFDTIGTISDQGNDGKIKKKKKKKKKKSTSRTGSSEKGKETTTKGLYTSPGKHLRNALAKLSSFGSRKKKST